jgi:hypothetical protein
MADDQQTCRRTAMSAIALALGCCLAFTIVGFVGGVIASVQYRRDPYPRDECATYLKARCLESCGCAFCKADATCYPNDASAVSALCAGNVTATPLCEDDPATKDALWIMFGVGSVGFVAILGILPCAGACRDGAGNDDDDDEDDDRVEDDEDDDKDDDEEDGTETKNKGEGDTKKKKKRKKRKKRNSNKHGDDGEDGVEVKAQGLAEAERNMRLAAVRTSMVPVWRMRNMLDRCGPLRGFEELGESDL